MPFPCVAVVSGISWEYQPCLLRRLLQSLSLYSRQEEGDVPMQQQQMGKRAWEAAGVQQPSRGPNEVHYQRYTVDQLEAIAQDPRSSMPLMHSQGHSQGHSYGDDFPSDVQMPLPFIE